MYIPKITNLPSILTCNDGSCVTTAKEWESKRRGEIYDFLPTMYMAGFLRLILRFRTPKSAPKRQKALNMTL